MQGASLAYGCDCWDAELPCWPCYRDGFDVPNPSAVE